MFKLSVFIFLLMLIALSDQFLSDPVKVFHFRKDTFGSGEFDYKYKNNGDNFFGRTLKFSNTEKNPYVVRAPNGTFYDVERHVFLMEGAHRTFYWMDLTDNELRNPNSFSRYVRSVRTKSESGLLAYFMDNFKEYRIYDDGSILYGYYSIDWNLDSVCFRKSPTEKKRFFYTILSKNNSRRFEGTILVDRANEDTKVRQFVHNGVYKVKFSREEFNSMAFCKSIKLVPFEELEREDYKHYVTDQDHYVLSYSKSGINPQLLHALKKL